MRCPELTTSLTLDLQIGNYRCQVKTVTQPSAILDLHFQQLEGKRDVFAVASSTASLSIFRLLPSADSNAPELELVSVIRIKDVGEDVLFLSCAWHPNIPDMIAVTTSTGAVHVLAIDMDQRSAILPQTIVLTHTLETWTVAFSPYTPQPPSQAAVPSEDYCGNSDGQPASYITVYSGGDDSLLQYTSYALPLHSPPDKKTPHLAPISSCKSTEHNAGVTAILPVLIENADGGRIVVTGSYDDSIRVFSILDPVSTGGIRRATCLAEQNLGGGVWRLKLMSHSWSDGGRRWKVRALASCMHAGARVIDIHGDISGACQISVAARFEEHKSMNYGSDFIYNDRLLCISTSFYDKLLCIWEVKHTAGEGCVLWDAYTKKP